MGSSPDVALPRLIDAVQGLQGSARAELLGPSFLLRTTDGALEEAGRLGLGFGRLCDALASGSSAYLGDAYVLVEPGSGASTFWLVHLAGERLGAAFEYARRADAIEAVPLGAREPSALEIVRRAIWAFVAQDVGTMMSLLAPDFAYTDAVRGTTLNGASEVVNGLLLTFSDLPDRGLADLELSQLQEGMVRAQGILTRPLPGDPDARWRWRTLSGVVDGRIRWTVREPDARMEED